MINKIKENLLRIVLTVMVAISFYLSYLIWMSPVTRDTLLRAESEFEVIEEVSQEINAEEVFLPIKVRYKETDENQETQNESLLKQMQTILSNKKYGETKWKTYFNEVDYFKAIEFENGLELTYGMIFPLAEYIDLFNLNLTLSEEEQVQIYFTKIQLDIKRNVIRFINDEDWTVLSVTPEKKSHKCSKF
ncbi:hypothetical protein ACFQOY_02245 [Enterococcus alcedinis]|uniref:hypothetical protein n=1 Tax=Enterococcus alcedinis TaxID=1274384 RepID=UPI003620D14B